MKKEAVIRQGGLFKKGQVLIRNIKADGEEGDTKVYTVSGKVKAEEMDGKVILRFISVTGGSVRVSNRGTVSGGAYTRRVSVAVDSWREE